MKSKTYSTGPNTTEFSGLRFIYASDLDGNGDPDVLSVVSPSKIAWYENQIPQEGGQEQEPATPRLYLSTGYLEDGGTVTVTGDRFTPSSEVTLYVNGPSGFEDKALSLTADGDGAISHDVSLSSSDPSGTYSFSARDTGSGEHTTTKELQHEVTPPSVSIRITNPSDGDTFFSDDNIVVQWVDIIQTGSVYPEPVGAQRSYRYRIEYKGEAGDWTEIATKSGSANVGTVETLEQVIEPPSGSLELRVVDDYDQSRVSESVTISVDSPSEEAQVELA